ncbi:hypothetical protein CC80DRAFT_496496 [Byssothecium circinans]|uniref:G-patch domain-containing protein n=1 Tax=Byssothecium circinans TaxID=147558 RepID=A0A6A5TFR0_9PLEO|nr:hypothetical protein CC80DRAFT_496496 [Byssothecium circinans]
MDAPEEQPKRKRNFRQESQKKKPKLDDGTSGSFSGFGAKMMAKMGYTGGGLGRSGEGIEEAIAVKVRPTKVGIGGVREKTDQQKREERRKAEQNGEKYDEDSEDEQRAARRRKKGTSTGASTPRSAPSSRPKKTIFQTEAAIEAAGIHIPQSLLLASGESASTSTLSLRADHVPFQSALASRVQRELTAFEDSVTAMASERESIEHEMENLSAEIEHLEIQMKQARDITSRLQSLQKETEWSVLVQGLQDLQSTYPSKRFEKEAIALMHPLFAQTLSSWDPSSGNTLSSVAKAFQELRNIIDPSSRPSEQPSIEVGPSTHKRSTPYESLMLLLWNQLHAGLLKLQPDDDTDTSTFLALFDVWQPSLPPFLVRRATRAMELKVLTGVEKWNPQLRKKTSSPLPQWIFPWLRYCTVWTGTLKSKVKSILQRWSIDRGVIPGINIWRKAFPREMDQLLVNILLPRLAKHLSEFEIDPSDQKLDLLNEVLAWIDILSSRIMAELIHVEFFEKKFMPVLHSWLTYEGRNLGEISAWLAWWRDEVLPKTLVDIPIHESDWDAAYNLVNTSLDLESQGQGLENLELPAAEPVRAPSPGTPNLSKSVNTEPPQSTHKDATELSFKDIVESWCAEENVLLIPLRKADEATGFPLFRITASATGKGGVVVYFKGDVIFTQNKKDKSVWEPAGFDENLISKAEGK